MMDLKGGAALCCAVLIAGCTVPYSPTTPLAGNFSGTSQARLQAAAHWNAISDHIEKELAPALKKGPDLPLYVDALQATSFNQIMANQLITSLVNDGYVVSKTPIAALRVEINTQVVAFSANRPQYKFSGNRSALGGEAWALSDVQNTASWMTTVAIAGEDAYSWFRSMFASGKMPKTEIIVTLSVSDERRYYARYTSVYYVTDNDRMLYEVAPTKSFSVKGG